MASGVPVHRHRPKGRPDQPAADVPRAATRRLLPGSPTAPDPARSRLPGAAPGGLGNRSERDRGAAGRGPYGRLQPRVDVGHAPVVGSFGAGERQADPRASGGRGAGVTSGLGLVGIDGDRSPAPSTSWCRTCTRRGARVSRSTSHAAAARQTPPMRRLGVMDVDTVTFSRPQRSGGAAQRDLATPGSRVLRRRPLDQKRLLFLPDDGRPSLRR